MTTPCMSKKVVELRQLARDYNLPNRGNLKTKAALCEAVERYEVEQKSEREEEEEEEEEENSSEPSKFPQLDQMTDQFHWQYKAVPNTLNGYDIFNLPKGRTFWYGTSLLFPQQQLPFGESFYGDIQTAYNYALQHIREDGFARILSATNVRPLAIVKINTPNFIRLRKSMDASEDTHSFVPLLNYAFPLSDDQKRVSRRPDSSHDAALNYGLQINMPRLRVDGWCTLSEHVDSWHDEICFRHDRKNPLLERGLDEFLLMPRYRNTLLHFHNGAFVGFIDTRNQGRDSLTLDQAIPMTNLSAAFLTVPEVAYVVAHRRQMDASYQALIVASNPIPTAPKVLPKALPKVLPKASTNAFFDFPEPDLAIPLIDRSELLMKPKKQTPEQIEAKRKADELEDRLADERERNYRARMGRK